VTIQIKTEAPVTRQAAGASQPLWGRGFRPFFLGAGIKLGWGLRTVAVEMLRRLMAPCTRT
jgi:uncharacterized protein involved in response to NO